MDELTLYLQRFNTEVVEASRKVSRDIICHCMNSVIDVLLRRIGDLDNRMKCYVPSPTQYCFEAMKVSSTDEFEVLVVLDRLATVRTFRDLAETSPNLACYGEVLLPREEHVPVCEDLVETDASNTRFLSAAKVRRYFAYLASQVASDTFHNNSIQVTYKEPYTQVKISKYGETYLFQLMPALFFYPGWPLCADSWGQSYGDSSCTWPTPQIAATCRQLGFFALPALCPHSEKETVWRISFIRSEKLLLHYDRLDSPQGVVRQVERILKVLRTADPDAFRPLSSYHLRTVVLHACQQHPDSNAWAVHRLGEQLLEVLRQLIQALEKGELRHFFVPQCNLLAQYSHQELAATAQRLRDIHEEFRLAPGQSIRLQC